MSSKSVQVNFHVEQKCTSTFSYRVSFVATIFSILFLEVCNTHVGARPKNTHEHTTHFRPAKQPTATFSVATNITISSKVVQASQQRRGVSLSFSGGRFVNTIDRVHYHLRLGFCLSNGYRCHSCVEQISSQGSNQMTVLSDSNQQHSLQQDTLTIIFFSKPL